MPTTPKFAWLLLGLSLLAAACQPKGPRKLEDCPYGRPKAVFSEAMPGISAHQFVEEPYAATERFHLGDTLTVTLIQSGCEKPVQEFRFEMPPPQPNSADSHAFWAAKAVDLLYVLANLDASTTPLSAWAQAIEAQIPNFILGESLPIQQDTYVRIDRIRASEGVILLLTLGANPS